MVVKTAALIFFLTYKKNENCCCRQKTKHREEKEYKSLINRLNRIEGDAASSEVIKTVVTLSEDVSDKILKEAVEAQDYEVEIFKCKIIKCQNVN